MSNHNVHFSTVSQLINGETNTWIEDRVKSILNESQAKRVLAIPLSRTWRHDTFVWCHDGSGEYSTKSGYKVLIESDSRYGTTQPMTTPNVSIDFFITVWSLKLPRKIKIIFWRFINNLLPKYVNLARHRLHVEITCPLCRATEEFVDHLLRFCTVTKQLSDALFIRMPPVLQTQGYSKWLALGFNQLSKKEKGFLFITYWLSGLIEIG